MTTRTPSIREPEDLQRAQRRGRIVIVSVVALFLAVCVALGLFLWQREQQEGQLEELTRAGLTSVAVPQWGPPVAEVAPLEDNQGLSITYRDTDGTTVPQLRALNLRAGPSTDSCEVLARAEPDLAQGCETTGDRLTASSNGPDTLLLAEGRRHDQTLLVLVAHSADATPEALAERVDQAESMSVRELLNRFG